MLPLILIALLAYSWKPPVKKKGKKLPIIQSEDVPVRSERVDLPAHQTIERLDERRQIQAPSSTGIVPGPGGSFLTSTGGQLLAAALARRVAPPSSGVAIASDVAAGFGAARAGLDLAKSTRDLFKQEKGITQPSDFATPLERVDVSNPEGDWRPKMAVDVEDVPPPPVDYMPIPSYDPSLEPVIDIPTPEPIIPYDVTLPETTYTDIPAEVIEG